ncbi:MAG: hypothetical protein EBU90_19435 [Proteobacteria bacterium]|nr:hypothetical protein [Pseudomonadota bacterium]NBP16257.1 hypothetical protein [bacterium]
MKLRYLFFVSFLHLQISAQVGFNKVGYQDANTISNIGVELFRGVAIDSQGRIIAAGRTDTDGAIVCYKADGSLDTTFNVNSINGGPGYINQEADERSHQYCSIALDSQDRIIVVGTARPMGQERGLIVRYNRDGTLDETFNATGFIISSAEAVNALIYYSVAIDAQDRIIVGGQLLTDPFNSLLVRYNVNGTLDQVLDNGTFHNGQYYGVALDSRGRIIAAGWYNNPGNKGLIVRYNADGTSDLTFNANSIDGAPGYINLNSGTGVSQYNGVAIDAQDNIIVVGGESSPDASTIVRYTVNGNLDTSFNRTGFFIDTTARNYLGVICDREGRIIVVGSSTAFKALAVCYNPDGSRETLVNKIGYFDCSYKNIFDNLAATLRYYSVVIDSQQKIIVVGSFVGPSGLVARYIANGVLDAQSNWNSKNYRVGAQINGQSIGLLSN